MHTIIHSINLIIHGIHLLSIYFNKVPELKNLNSEILSNLKKKHFLFFLAETFQPSIF